MIRGTAGVHPRCTRVGGRFRVAVGASATLLWFPRAPVAQGIEHRPPEAGAGVRIAPGAHGSTSTKRPLTSGYAVKGLSRVSDCVRLDAAITGRLCRIRADVSARRSHATTA